MKLAVVLFEDRQWRKLRPLTDVLPVPALAFGASTLADRLLRASGGSLCAIEARADVLAAWRDRPALAAQRPAAGDSVLVLNAAALPGDWIALALEARASARLVRDGRIAAVRLSFRELEPLLGRAGDFEAALGALALSEQPCEARFITWPWNLVEWNAQAIADDLGGRPGAHEGEVDPRAVLLEPSRIEIQAGARIEPLAVLDARTGPIRIGRGALVRAHTVVTGPCAIGAGTQLLGGFVSQTTFGPECRIAGEVEACIWQGYSNKRHHGFVGHSVIGEWANLGALTTTSDLKNNYGSVRVWIDGAEVDSRSSKVGSILGAHVKTGIGTLLPSGASVGVGANLFAGGAFAPKHVPAFAWWDGERAAEHRLDAFLATARIAMSRRGRTLEAEEEQLLSALHATTAAERARV